MAKSYIELKDGMTRDTVAHLLHPDKELCMTADDNHIIASGHLWGPVDEGSYFSRCCNCGKIALGQR